MKTITPEMAIEVLEELVDEYGEDYVYKKRAHRFESNVNCLYIHDEGIKDGDIYAESLGDLINPTPGCIVGHALVRLGVPMGILLKNEGFPARNVLNRLRNGGFIDFQPKARDIFNNAQIAQDSGRTWGDALTIARSILENYS